MADMIDSFSTRDAAQPENRGPGTNSGTTWLDTVRRAFDREIRRHESFFLVTALAVLTVFSLLFAWRQPFDVDEYLVRETALSSSPMAVWRLLRTAPLSVDPPLYHFLIYYCLRILGPSEFFTRLPSVLAYTCMCFLLYRFVRRYTDVYTGLAVVALCLLCGTFPFAYDARPYALVLAADTLALVCWARIVDQRQRRKRALLGLFLGVAIAVGSHWFGFLVLVPLVLGETVRTWQKRSIDAQVWASLVASAGTALAYLPLLKAASEYRALPAWGGVRLGNVSDSFQLVLEPCMLPLTLLLVVSALARLFSAPPPKAEGSSVPRPVIIGVVGFALAPLAGFLVGKFVTHALQPRYVLLCTIGLLILVALAIRDAVRRVAIWMALAVSILGGCALVLRYDALLGVPAGGDAMTFADVSIFSAKPNLPIVPGVDGLFLRLEAHAPASLRARCIFPTDPDFVRLLHQNTSFLMTEALRRKTRLPITDLSSFLNSHPQFYLIDFASSPGWLVQRMLNDHAEIALQGTYAGNPVYLVQVRR